MGNVLPGLDAEKKEVIEGIAKDYLSTFSIAYVQAYGVEVARLKLNEIEEEACGETNKPKKELKYRETVPLTDPLKTGYMIKQGAVVKNWKKRYFVVRPDYIIDYYENQEAYEKGFKAKGSIVPAGYKVEEDADGSILQRLKIVAKKLGADENDVPTPVKYPDYTFELYHNRRRPYYITAENEEEKGEWMTIIKDCCYRCWGLKNPDPIAQVAFKDAERQARRELGYYYGYYGRGTEEQILSDTIVDAIDRRVMSDVYSSLSTMPGGYMVRKKVREQVVKSLDSLVMAMVIPSYKAQVEATSKIKAPIEDLIMEKKDDIIGAQNKLSSKITEQLSGTVGEVLGDVNKQIDTLVFKFKDILTKCIPILRENVVSVFEYVTNKAKDNDDIEASLPQYFRILDQARFHGRFRSKLSEVYQAIYEVIRNSPLLEDLSWNRVYWDGRDMMNMIIDGAAFTFEELFKELVKGTDALQSGKTAADIMTTCKDQVLPKFDADAKLLPDEASFALVRYVIIENLTNKLEPVTKSMRRDLRSSLPEAVRKVVSVDERYEAFIKKISGDIVKNAITNEEGSNEQSSQPEVTPSANEQSSQPEVTPSADDPENGPSTEL